MAAGLRRRTFSRLSRVPAVSSRATPCRASSSDRSRRGLVQRLRAESLRLRGGGLPAGPVAALQREHGRRGRRDEQHDDPAKATRARRRACSPAVRLTSRK